MSVYSSSCWVVVELWIMTFKTQFNSQFLISKNRILADVLEDLDSKE